jgi:scyllo-inositol 2-dehydrogenase (NAD+)
VEKAGPAASPLKAAIVGCGRIGVARSARLAGRVHASMLPVSHAESMLATGKLDVVAFCDVDQAKAHEACSAYGTGAPFSDLEAMLRQCAPEIVSVATRAQHRADIVQTLTARGVRGIYAEKPFSRSLAECHAALRAVERAGAKLVLGTPRRYTRLHRRAREIAASGRLGQLTRISIGLDPRSLLLWTVPHYVDLLIFFAGGSRVGSVAATCEIPPEAVSGDVIDCDPVVQSAIIQFDNGVIGTLDSAERFGVTLVCERGAVQIFEARPAIRVVPASPAPQPDIEDEPIDDEMSGTVRAFGELADSVLQAQPAPISHDDVILNQALLIGIAVSSLRGGERTDLNQLPLNLSITGKLGGLYA